ncbi:DUF4913 domain-containing protein [Actinoallomurus sp. NPDC052308]|uniref:DUF4913 domain-containing protein n=1 Tax=Actinoallomurus sp. NPDC052308 TaxID=3155530 RepID=UPI00341E1CA4
MTEQQNSFNHRVHNDQSGLANSVVQAGKIFGDIHFHAALSESPDYPYEPGYEDDIETPEPVYLTVEEFVTKRFVPMYRRVLGDEFRWCSHWWDHAEAIAILTGLWHSWETMRLQPGTGMVTWYRDFLYPLLPIMMGPNGPFAMCSEYEHRPVDEALCIPAPDGYWDIPDRSSESVTDGQD